MGSNQNILFENENKNGYIHGFSSNYVRVKTPWRKDLVDCIKPYKLKNIDAYCSVAESRQGYYKLIKKTKVKVESYAK